MRWRRINRGSHVGVHLFNFFAPFVLPSRAGYKSRQRVRTARCYKRAKINLRRCRCRAAESFLKNANLDRCGIAEVVHRGTHSCAYILNINLKKLMILIYRAAP